MIKDLGSESPDGSPTGKKFIKNTFTGIVKRRGAKRNTKTNLVQRASKAGLQLPI